MSSFQNLSDLHRHLDGSLRLETLIELAAKQNLVIPEDLYFYKGMGLQTALKSFGITLSVLQTPSAVCRVAAEICEDAQKEGISTLEIRFAPQLHKKASVEDIVDAAIEGVAGRAGIILCGLYGESPAVLKHLVETAKTRSAVVGIDLAGGPQSSDTWNIESYADVFILAHKLGIHRTVHAGEGRGPEEIEKAILLLKAERIGHGTTLLQDPKVVDLVLEREVTIEACPTSNVQTGVIESVESHPLLEWLELGIQVCINTDNTLFSKINIRQELENVRAIPGIQDSHLEQLIAFGQKAHFKR